MKIKKQKPSFHSPLTLLSSSCILSSPWSSSPYVKDSLFLSCLYFCKCPRKMKELEVRLMFSERTTNRTLKSSSDSLGIGPPALMPKLWFKVVGTILSSVTAMQIFNFKEVIRVTVGEHCWTGCGWDESWILSHSPLKHYPLDPNIAFSHL